MWERKIEERPLNRVSLVIFLSRIFLSMLVWTRTNARTAERRDSASILSLSCLPPGVETPENREMFGTLIIVK